MCHTNQFQTSTGEACQSYIINAASYIQSCMQTRSLQVPSHLLLGRGSTASLVLHLLSRICHDHVCMLCQGAIIR